MLFKAVLMAACLSSAVFADYVCVTNLGQFTISQADAEAAKNNGGTEKGKSGFPHSFGGGSGSGTQLKFYGADAKCNEKDPKLLEFPVFSDGKKYDKGEKHGTTATPARVVYLDNGETLCGVMTHVVENKENHSGSGDFRVCDKS